MQERENRSREARSPWESQGNLMRAAMWQVEWREGYIQGITLQMIRNLEIQLGKVMGKCSPLEKEWSRVTLGAWLA